MVVCVLSSYMHLRFEDHSVSRQTTSSSSSTLFNISTYSHGSATEQIIEANAQRLRTILKGIAWSQTSIGYSSRVPTHTGTTYGQPCCHYGRSAAFVWSAVYTIFTYGLHKIESEKTIKRLRRKKNQPKPRPNKNLTIITTKPVRNGPPKKPNKKINEIGRISRASSYADELRSAYILGEHVRKNHTDEKKNSLHNIFYACRSSDPEAIYNRNNPFIGSRSCT